MWLPFFGQFLTNKEQKLCPSIKEVSEVGREVKEVIVAIEDDLKIRRALSIANNIDYCRYQVSFKLLKNK